MKKVLFPENISDLEIVLSNVSNIENRNNCINSNIKRLLVNVTIEEKRMRDMYYSSTSCDSIGFAELPKNMESMTISKSCIYDYQSRLMYVHGSFSIANGIFNFFNIFLNSNLASLDNVREIKADCIKQIEKLK